MAKIIDPDKLSQSTAASTGTPSGNVYFDTSNKTIELIHDGADGGLSPNELLDQGYDDGGVSLQALYSFIKERWKSDATLIKYPFPMEAITAEQFEFINGWTLTDGTGGLQDSKKLIRDAGYAERDTSNVVQKQYAGIISLGTLADTSAGQPYYAFADDVVKTDTRYIGRVNEAILIYDQTVSPIVDDRSKVLTLYIRSAPTGVTPNAVGYTFAQTTTTDIGVSVLSTQAYRFPLTQAVDPNIDTAVGDLSSGVYANMRIEYYSSAQTITETGTNFDVGVVIDAYFSDTGTQPTVKQIYNWVQNELRKATDINVSPGDETNTFGLLTDPLVEFVGSTLKTLRQGDGDGVFIEGVGSNDFNNVEFIDNSGTSRSFPFKVGLNLQFNENIGDDPNASYKLFYTTLTDVVSSPDVVKNFGTGDAVIVTKDGGGNIEGDVHTVTATIASGNTATSSSPPTGSITASTGVLSDATDSGTWTVDDLIGDIIYIKTGTNAGKYYITDNDATSITIDPAGKPFDVNDTAVDWEILERNDDGTGGTPLITATYNYAENTDAGKAANINAGVTLVAIGLDSAQYATATATIERVNSVNIPVSNALERNYEDPQGV